MDSYYHYYYYYYYCRPLFKSMDIYRAAGRSWWSFRAPFTMVNRPIQLDLKLSLLDISRGEENLIRSTTSARESLRESQLLERKLTNNALEGVAMKVEFLTNFICFGLMLADVIISASYPDPTQAKLDYLVDTVSQINATVTGKSHPPSLFLLSLRWSSRRCCSYGALMGMSSMHLYLHVSLPCIIITETLYRVKDVQVNPQLPSPLSQKKALFFCIIMEYAFFT